MHMDKWKHILQRSSKSSYVFQTTTISTTCRPLHLREEMRNYEGHQALHVPPLLQIFNEMFIVVATPGEATCSSVGSTRYTACALRWLGHHGEDEAATPPKRDCFPTAGTGVWSSCLWFFFTGRLQCVGFFFSFLFKCTFSLSSNAGDLRC